jgi:ribosomal protein S27AE
MVLDAAGRSDFYWDSARLQAPLARQRQLRAEEKANELQRRPSLAASAISQLTAEQVSDLSDQEQEFDDAEEEGPEKKMTCRRCGSVGFEARRGMEGVRLVCGGCGLRMPLTK